MTLKAVEKVTIDDLLGRLNSAGDFSAFFKQTIVYGSPTQEIKGHEDMPAGAVKELYIALLDNQARRGQLDAFEEAAFRILLDQSQYFGKAYDKEFVGVHIHKSMLEETYIRDAENAITSPNLKSGKWAELIKPHIDLEGIASGKVRYEPEKPREADVNMTFRHQRMLASNLILAQTKEGLAEEFWKKIAGNPSFLETKFELAFLQGGDAEQFVPGLIKFYNRYYSNEHVKWSEYIFSTVKIAGLLDESATVRYLRERAEEFERVCVALKETYPGLLKQLNRAAVNSVLSTFGEIYVLTGHQRSGRTVTVECMHISENGIERGITATARLEEEPEDIRKLLKAPEGRLFADNDSLMPKSSWASCFRNLEFSYRSFRELYDKASKVAETGRQLEMKLQA